MLDVERRYAADDWQVEGRQIATNLGDPLNIAYIAKVTDPGQYDAGFVSALSARLAWALAMPITASPTMAQEMERAFKAAMREARGVSAREGKPQTVYADEFLESRF